MRGERKQFLVADSPRFDPRRFLFQIVRQHGQALHIGSDLVPIRLLDKLFPLPRRGEFVPGPEIVAAVIQQIFVAQERAAPHGPVFQIGVDIRLHAALRGVNFQSGQYGQGLGFLPAALPLFRGTVFVIGDDAAIKGRVAKLPDSGGKGIAHGEKTVMPVVGVAERRFFGGNIEQRQIAGPFQLPRFIVPPDALIQQRIGYRLDHVAVVVRAAETLRGQHFRVHHDHVGEMPQIEFPHVVLDPVRFKLEFLIPRDMGIAQKRTGAVVWVSSARRVERHLKEMLALCNVIVGFRFPFFRFRILDQHTEQRQQVAGEKTVVARDQQAAPRILLQNALRLILQLPHADRFMDEQRILFQNPAQDSLPPYEIREAVFPVGADVIVSLFRRLRDPMPPILRWAVLPAERQIPRTELVIGHGERVQKLVIQFRQTLRLRLADIGNIQRMVIFLKSGEIVRPTQSVFRQPREPLEHTARENDVHLSDRVPDAPYIRDMAPARVGQKLLEIHLMQHPLDKGHTDLERGVNRLATVGLVNRPGKLFGDQSLAVKGRNLDRHPFLSARVGARPVHGFPTLHGNHVNILHGKGGIVHDDDAVRFRDPNAVDPGPAGEHQAEVGVELRELALAHGHVQQDAAAHLLINVRAKEGQLRLTAHAAGTLKREITMLAGAEVQPHTLRAEHGLRLPLALQIACRAAVVEDAGEVRVEDNVLQTGNDLGVRVYLRKGSAVQHAHRLIKQRVILLLIAGVEKAFVCRSRIEMEGVAVAALHSVAEDGADRERMDFIFSCHTHHLTRGEYITEPPELQNLDTAPIFVCGDFCEGGFSL